MHLSSSIQLACAALATLALAAAAPQGSQHHHVARRSFFELECKGVYDANAFRRLDRICEDCYGLFRETQLHSLCRANCFTSPFFKACVQALYLGDEEEQLDQMIDYIGKR